MIGERLKVLIVDDEQSVCGYVKKALDDYEVLEASDGEEAMVLIRVARPRIPRAIADGHGRGLG